MDAGLQIFEAIGIRRPDRFVIASVLLEVRALEGSEIDGPEGRPQAENRSRLVTRRGSQSSFVTDEICQFRLVKRSLI
jgi:hypothetical protein